MPLVTSPALPPLPRMGSGEAEACIVPHDSEAPKKNHMSPHPDSLPPDFSHLDPLAPNPSQNRRPSVSALPIARVRGRPAPLPPGQPTLTPMSFPAQLHSSRHSTRAGQASYGEGGKRRTQGPVSKLRVSTQGTQPPRGSFLGAWC